MSHRILRLREVIKITGLSRTTIYRRVKEGQFPKPLLLGSAHTHGWLESEVNEWIELWSKARR